MSSIVFTETKAIICLFATLFALAVGEGQVYFTTKPKDKEVFVGERVQFDWDYTAPDAHELRFGVIVNDQEAAIVVKNLKDGSLKFNNMHDSIKWIRDRVEAVPGRRASFTINPVSMEDSVTFFCSLIYGEAKKSVPDKVKLTVVDLLIDKLPSSQTAESWQGRKITVVCAVKIPEGDTRATFSWMHIPSNKTIARESHEDTRSKSFLTLTTYEDEDFEALQCRAETKVTVKFHVINITKLNSPTEPRNLKAERSFNKETARPFIRLRWDPPRDNGGADIENYVISYIPNGLSWKSATTKETDKTEFNDLKLPSGNIYIARVRARNKAGTGPSSNEVEINLEDDPMGGRLSDNMAQHHLPEVCLLLLSFVVSWFL